MSIEDVSSVFALLALGLVAMGCSAQAGGESLDDGSIDVASDQALSNGDGTTTVRFVNHCGVALHVASSAAGFFATIPNGGFYDRNVGSATASIPTRMYYAVRAGTNLSSNDVDLAEFTFNESGTKDCYDVSLVNGFNVPMRIDGSGVACPLAACQAKLNLVCPGANQIIQNGVVVACSKKGDRDNLNNPVAVLAQEVCPNAYAWSGDGTKTRTCAAEDYVVTFCP